MRVSLVTSSLGYVFFVIFWLYQRYGLGLSFYTRARFCCDHCLRGSSRHKRFRAFSRQPARVPRKRPFPGRFFRVFPRPSIYPFVKAKPVSTLVFKWKSCFHNSLDKALYLPHYSRKLTIWHKPCGVIWNHACKSLCAEPMCVKILYEHQVRVATGTRKRLLENEWFICFTQDIFRWHRSLLIFTILYTQGFILFWFGLVRLFLMQQ